MSFRNSWGGYCKEESESVGEGGGEALCMSELERRSSEEETV